MLRPCCCNPSAKSSLARYYKRQSSPHEAAKVLVPGRVRDQIGGVSLFLTKRGEGVSEVWCYARLMCCIGLILMFVGGAIEQTSKDCCIGCGMSGHQVQRVWGQPERVTVSDFLFPEMCPATTICIWTYQNPYRLVVFRDGVVVRIAERAERSLWVCMRALPRGQIR